MKILVTGSRRFKDKKTLSRALKSYCLPNESIQDSIEVAHGGARGADTLAQEFCDAYHVKCTVFMADWDGNGKAAGVIRNKTMLDSFNPDLVLAFPIGPWEESRGTFHMIKYAFSKGCPVTIYPG